MPELPEVETIIRDLEPHVVGHRVTGVTLLWEGIVRNPAPEEFVARLVGRQITRISRRGKYLVFDLSSGDLLIIHLKMSGTLWLKPPDRFTRAIIHLDNTDIFFRDPRKFGTMRLERDRAIVDRLGPEPLEPAFTSRLLGRILDKRKAPVKAVIVDQALIAGIGNMYADEALFEAGILPTRPADSLSAEEVTRLARAIRKVLRAGIRDSGASTETYFRPDGTRGTAHIAFRVAHRRGANCRVCGTPIKRIVVRGRGTYFCPRCQR